MDNPTKNLDRGRRLLTDPAFGNHDAMRAWLYTNGLALIGVAEAARAWNEARKAINDRSHPDHLKWSRTGMEILPLTQALDDALAALEG